MDKYNLTFNGEILPGQDLAEVKARFAEALAIDDPSRVNVFFSGKEVTLRRNLDKRTAEAFYTKMYRTGAVLKLVVIEKETSPPRPATGIDHDFHRGNIGNVEQSWPVRSPSTKKPAAASSRNKRGNAVLQAEALQRKEAEEVAAALESKKRLAVELTAKQAAERAVKLRAEQKRKYEAEVAQAKVKETARLQALEEKARKKAAEEVARKKAAEEAARIKAAEEATRKKVAEEAARKKAAEEAARKKIAEEAARKKAAEEAARKKAAEEAARKKAAEEAARKKAAEEAARIKAAEEAARKKIAEEAARKKAAEEAARKKIAEEAARKKAAEVAARKKVAEEAARKKAAEEAARNKVAEEADRKKAAEEAARKKAAAEVAREKAAKEAAQKKAAEEAVRKKAAEEAARKKALKLEAKKEAAAKATRLRAELAQQKRIHAEEAARARADEKRIEDELRVLAAAQQTEDAAQAAALKKKQQEEAKQKAAEKAALVHREKQALEHAAKQRAEEQRQEQAALDRAAEGSARLEMLQNVARVKKPLATLPKRGPTNGHRRRQPGAPNLFSLKPFRNTAEIRQRADKSQQLMKALFIASVATLLALLVLATRYALLPPMAPTVSGPNAVIVAPHSGLVITAGEQLFFLDRSGVDSDNTPLSQWGINSQINLLDFDAAGKLVIQEKQESTDGAATWATLSCEVETQSCQTQEPDLFTQGISSYIIDSRTGDTYLASAAIGLLSKLDNAGKLLGQVEIDMPERPTLALHEGLLYINSATGPAISIYRPDNKGFGEQLDEVLLLPAPAVEKEQTQIGAFVWSANSWWVAMQNPDTLESSLYRFDANWKFLSSVTLSPNSNPEQLVAWGDKVLVLDSTAPAIQRFNSQGQAEAPLTPVALQSYIDNAQHSVALSQKLWHASLGLLALVGIGTYLLGRLHQVRSLVYSKDKVRGAEPVDDKEKMIHWIDPENSRSSAYRKLAISYGILCFSVLALIFFLALPAAIMLAATLLFTGPAIALTLLWNSQSGHIGVINDQLILVDQHDMYHMGGGPRVHYRNNFLLLDDIVVFIGTRRLPVFSTEQLAAKIVPLALAGVKVDRKTVAIKLIQSAHPIAKGLYACAACMAAAILCLLLY